MLLLLLLAMGWAVTNQEFNNKAKVLIFSTWVWYTLTHCLLHWGKKVRMAMQGQRYARTSNIVLLPDCC